MSWSSVADSPVWLPYALGRRGLEPVALEASDRAAGSWPRYYDSLTLFSPARYSSLPGLPFGGDGNRCPRRDEVVEYLLRYGHRLDAEIRTEHRVTQVRKADRGFVLTLEGGTELAARGVIAATGGFGRLNVPAPPGLANYTGHVLHVARYRFPEAFAGKPDRRPLFTAIEGDRVTWRGGTAESVDAIVLATGYRPDPGFLAPLGALDEAGRPLHREGMSLIHAGLGFVGLEWQRSLSSASLRGVGRDAGRVARRLANQLAAP